MARVNFVRPFDYYPLWPSKAVWIRYPAGEHTVKRQCAEQAIAEGAGIEIKTHRRKKAVNG